MFSKIMVPIDLAHTESLGKAVDLAGQLAKINDARIVFVGVTESQPGTVAHNPAEFDGKLSAFANAQGTRLGVETSAVTVVSHDPAVDMNETLLDAITSTSADLCVMQTHVPGLLEYVWSSHGGGVASHAKISVFLVR